MSVRMTGRYAQCGSPHRSTASSTSRPRQARADDRWRAAMIGNGQVRFGPEATGKGSSEIPRQWPTGASFRDCSIAPLPLAWSSAFPPVVVRPIADHGGREVHLQLIAELPQLSCRTRVLEQNPIDIEGIQFTGPMTINSVRDVGDQRVQLGLVIPRDDRTRLTPLRLVGHRVRLLSRWQPPPTVSIQVIPG